MRNRVSLFALVVLGCSLVSAQQFWEKKSWTQWNSREVKQLLENSPWAQSQAVSDVVIQVVRRGAPSDPVNVPRITYTVQLRSAKIVRQAVVREAQLKAKYDNMSPQQKAAFDAKTESFLAGSGDAIAMHVSFDTNVTGYTIELQNHWGRQSADLLGNTVFLSLPGGRKISPMDYIPPRGGGFVLIFQRPSEPLTSGELHLEFMSPPVATLGETRISMGFKIAKMLVNGSFDY